MLFNKSTLPSLTSLRISSPNNVFCHANHARRPLDVVVIWRQVKEILMEELDMCLGFHREVRFQLGTLCQEGNVTVQYVNLLAFFRHERDAAPDVAEVQ